MEWYDVIVWCNLVECVEFQFIKGVQVYIEGKLIYCSWQDKDGNNCCIIEVVVSYFCVLSCCDGDFFGSSGGYFFLVDDENCVVSFECISLMFVLVLNDKVVLEMDVDDDLLFQLLID